MRWRQPASTPESRNPTRGIDPFRTDAAEDGARCYAPDGDLIGKVHLPEACANLCFGGKKRHRPFKAARTSIYSLYLDVQGAQLP